MVGGRSRDLEARRQREGHAGRRETEPSADDRDPDEHWGFRLGSTGSLRLGAGRSQVQILSPRSSRAPVLPGLRAFGAGVVPRTGSNSGSISSRGCSLRWAD